MVARFGHAVKVIMSVLDFWLVSAPLPEATTTITTALDFCFTNPFSRVTSSWNGSPKSELVWIIDATRLGRYPNPDAQLIA